MTSATTDRKSRPSAPASKFNTLLAEVAPALRRAMNSEE